MNAYKSSNCFTIWRLGDRRFSSNESLDDPISWGAVSERVDKPHGKYRYPTSCVYTHLLYRPFTLFSFNLLMVTKMKITIFISCLWFLFWQQLRLIRLQEEQELQSKGEIIEEYCCFILEHLDFLLIIRFANETASMHHCCKNFPFYFQLIPWSTENIWDLFLII